MSELTESLAPIVFSPWHHPLAAGLANHMDVEFGRLQQRNFPDGESYLRVDSGVKDRDCVIVADLAQPNEKAIPIIFLAETLYELGARSVGLVAPYLAYMRQDKRFKDGEAVTSHIFAKVISPHLNWMITIDPHLHRIHSLDEIYSMETRVLTASGNLAQLLDAQPSSLLIGPDAESEQWVSEIAANSGNDFCIAHKTRLGDHNVKIHFPSFPDREIKHATIVDDVISSGTTIVHCAQLLKEIGVKEIACVATHGIFAEDTLQKIYHAGVVEVITSNSITNPASCIDVSDIVAAEIKDIYAAKSRLAG